MYVNICWIIPYISNYFIIVVPVVYLIFHLKILNFILFKVGQDTDVKNKDQRSCQHGARYAGFGIETDLRCVLVKCFIVENVHRSYLSSPFYYVVDDLKFIKLEKRVEIMNTPFFRYLDEFYRFYEGWKMTLTLLSLK